MTITGAESSGEFDPEKVLISWWVTNTGPFTANEEFNVEIRFDGVTLAQWTIDGLSTNWFVSVKDRAGLLDGVRVSPGTHELSLVIDPLDTVNETSESDNTITRTITMLGSQEPDTPVELLPNLIPAPHNKKSSPIFASSHPDDPLSGKLTVDAASYVAIGAQNLSVQFVSQIIDLDLYFDDRLVRRLSWSSAAGSDRFWFAFADLRNRIDISPGPHTLRLVVDPLNRVRESNELDNSYEAEFTWGVGDPPDAEPAFVLGVPPPREPTLRANLMPFRPFGWDAAITAHEDNGKLAPGKDGWLDISKAVRVDLGFTNASRFSLPLTTELKADVLIDGTLYQRLSFDSGSSNVGTTWTDDVTLFGRSMTPGEHTIRVVLDPEGLFEELSETDNIFERVFTWHDGPDPEPEKAFRMTDQELAAAFAPIFGEMRREIRPVTGPGAGERDWTPEIKAAGRAAYYLVTGRDVDEEGYAVQFLPNEEFRFRPVQACMSDWITMTDTQYREAFEFCTKERDWAGFKTRSNGQVHLFMDLGFSPMWVLRVYLHELGHGLQDLTSPAQSSLPFRTNTRGLFEAEAQVFSAAAFRAIEEFTGESLSMFPDVEAARTEIAQNFDFRESRGSEHDIGYRLLWAQALAETAGLQTAEQLRTTGKLDSAAAMSLYNYLVAIPAARVESWAAEMLLRTDLIAEFRQISEFRLVQDLPLELTGHPALFDAIWMAP